MTSILPALLAKLTLILALGLIVSATLRSSSPSLRHLVLLATLASGLALPVVMLMSPRWNVPLLASSSSARSHDKNATSVTTRVTDQLASFADQQSSAAARPSPRARGNLGELPMLPLLWAIGFLGIILWLAMGRVRLGRIAATSWRLDDSVWSRLLEQERNNAGVAKLVQLFSSSVVSTPLTWGWRSPVILLPEDALDWPEEHRRIVLRHELAHIARGDSIAQLLAGFACALYWFHPLVWIAERRLRAECERSCDDTVVSLGTPAAEYAAHLLEVARSARAFGAPGFLSVAMARPSQLEGRLLAVLNGSQQRASLSRGAPLATAVASGLLLIPLAAFRAVPRADAGAVKRVSQSAARQSAGYSSRRADTTFQLSTPARSGGTLMLDLKTGGKVMINSWDRAEIVVRASLGGRDWRATRVRLEPSETGARLESFYTGTSTTQSFSHVFEITAPRNYNVRLSSAGGAVSITGLNGTFTGQTGGGEINIEKSSGEADIQTGGGDIHVVDSRLNGTVSTGGGVVRIEGVTGDLNGYSGSGPVTVIKSGGITITNSDRASPIGVTTGRGHSRYSIRSGSGIGGGSGSGSGTITSTYVTDGGKQNSSFAASGIRMNSAGGAVSLPAAPDGARVTTGGGAIRIGASGGEVYASTGGGPIDIGPATGSVEAHTGGGDVTIELHGAGRHSVDVTSGKGQVVLVLPNDLDATLDLETAYTNNLGHKTRIVSDFPLQTTETTDWDDSEGTPRRYVRVRQNIGRSGGVIRVRTVNGNIVLKRER